VTSSYTGFSPVFGTSGSFFFGAGTSGAFGFPVVVLLFDSVVTATVT
jgi:hypothetical protein